MFSFLILVLFWMASCLYSMLQDAIKNDGKHWFKYAVEIIVLMVAVFLKSINL